MNDVIGRIHKIISGLTIECSHHVPLFSFPFPYENLLILNLVMVMQGGPQ